MADSLRLLIHQAEQTSLKQALKRQAAHKRGEDFNIFPICMVDHYETIHSAILAELFNPRGTHGQDDLFLNLFLQRVARDVPDDAGFFDRFNSKNANVRTEYTISGGRLDILIRSEDSKQVIIIENKILAPDGDTQLFRYSDFAQKTWGDNHFRLLYLTLGGDDPSPDSAKGVLFQKISYVSTIISWIQDCILKAFDKPIIRETLIQYINHLKHLTGTVMPHKQNNELLDLMLKNPLGAAEIISSAPLWEEALLKKNLFEPLESFAKDKGWEFGNNLKSHKKENGEAFWFIIDNGLKIHFRTNASGWRGWYYGILDERLEKPKPHLLPGLTGGNDTWPYGWQYLDRHPDWLPNDLAEIAADNGEYLRYLKDILEQLAKVMDNEGFFKNSTTVKHAP